jgi:hypothetical protein
MPALADHDDPEPHETTHSPVRSAVLFVVIGLLLYGAAYHAAERLLHRTGHTNAFFKIEQAAPGAFDWVILGASHAMPLDFADFNAFMARETGTRILNLATPGAGVIYNRFVLEHFFTRHRTRRVLYVLDSFAFHSRQWNEERFSDVKLIRRTPLSPALVRRMLSYSRRGLIEPSVVLDYLSGFSKINNRERFQPDVWEGEARFERTHRPSSVADRQRIAYLYPPERADQKTFDRYVGQLVEFVEFLQRRDVELVVIKMPVPRRFYDLIPGEAAFDRTVSAVLAKASVPFHDFALTADDTQDFFDTDHLNHAGLTRFFERDLRRIIEGPRATGKTSVHRDDRSGTGRSFHELSAD